MVGYHSGLVKFPRVKFSSINGFLDLNMDTDIIDYLTGACPEVESRDLLKKRHILVFSCLQSEIKNSH